MTTALYRSKGAKPFDPSKERIEIMKNYLFHDDETGEDFFVQEESLSKANEIAHEYFKRPFFTDEMNDAEAEMYGYDTY